MRKQENVTNNDCIILKQEHSNGPIPEGQLALFQYGHLFHKDLNVHITLGTGDNCIQIGNDVCLVRNIFVNNAGDTYMAYQSFTHKERYFTYPCESTFLGIFKVVNVGEELHIAHCREIVNKFVLLPLQNYYIAMPLLH